MTKQTFADMQAELDGVIAKLESVDTDIDAAIQLHTKGQELIKKLKSYLDTAKNEVKHIK
jgi:exodeoxyribonuclease VII small subunit